MINYEDKVNMRSLALEDRPREKLMLHGRRHLSDTELISILIRSGSQNETAMELSQRILASYGNSLYELGKASVKDLSSFFGMGETKALSIIAALELGRRRKEIRDTKRPKISCSKDGFDVMHPVLADLNHEEFWILMLDAANKVKDKVMVSRGGRSGTAADPKIIFKTALDHHAAYIVLAHNHPSGNLLPSDEDIRLTRKLIEAGRLLDLFVLDHLIITGDSYCSLADDGHI